MARQGDAQVYGDRQLCEAQGRLAEALMLAESCAAHCERALALLGHADRRADCHAIRVARDHARRSGAVLRMHLAGATAAGSPTRSPLPCGLSAREAAVLQLIARGSLNREIAKTLAISIRTVERHIENLYHKIDVGGRADAVAFAIRHDLA